MKQLLLCLTAAMLLLTGCGDTEFTQSCYIQEVAHLQPDAVLPAAVQDASLSEKVPSEPLNYDTVRAVWIPVMQYDDWMAGQSAEAFRSHVREGFQSCADLGINTVYLHVRAYGDAYYRSGLFSKGAYLDRDYDPLAIMLEEAHALGLSAHAWINPMRCMETAGLSRLGAAYPLGQWYADPQKNGTYLVNVGDTWYLNPAYGEVRQLIADGVTEILEQYDVDGIHIDDYFYPTQEASFDAAAFAESGAEDLAAWRRENCNAMVKAIYDAVKAKDERLLFGISPQGNLSATRDKLYADAALWCSTPGYCDYIVPQIYYGFENSTCPFAETAALWAEIATEARLIVGLAPYKIGVTDKWAGTGSEEWRTDPTVLSREAALAAELEGVEGIALYSYASLFEPEEAVAVMVEAEVERLGEGWKTNSP